MKKPKELDPKKIAKGDTKMAGGVKTPKMMKPPKPQQMRMTAKHPPTPRKRVY